MMKIFKYVIILLFIMGCKSKPTENKSKDSDVIIVDSIPLKDGKSIFWYKLRDMLGSSSVSYIGVYSSACKIDTSRFLVKADLLYEINLIADNKLQTTSHSGIEIVRKSSDIEFVDKQFEYGQKFTRNTVKNEFILDSICK